MTIADSKLGEHLARATAAALVGAIVAGAAFLLTAASKITREEMVDHVDREVGPIESGLAETEALLRDLLIEQATIQTKLDILLSSNAAAEDR